MLHLSNQVTANLASLTTSRYQTHYNPGAGSGIYYMSAILVSDAVPFPTSAADTINYINSAINGSTYYGGALGNDANCLGIIDKIPSASIINSNIVVYDGLASFTAKNTGTVGGVIFTKLYGAVSTAPSTYYPITSATPLNSAGLLTGYNSTDEKKIYKYFVMTSSVGTSGNSSVLLSDVSLVAGSTYTFYGASFAFSSRG